MISEETRARWEERLDVVVKSFEYGQVTLNEWEEKFIDSISFQIAEGKDLSFKQSKVLNRLYEKC